MSAGARGSDARPEDPGSREEREARETEGNAAERRAPPAQVVHRAILREGEDELERPSSALFWSGLAAGLSMGFSLIAVGLLEAHLPDERWRPLIAELGYGLGFLIVVLGRQQLFTENTLTVILPLLERKDRATLLQVARLWAIVLVANLLGALLIALVAGHTDVFAPEVRDAFTAIGGRAVDQGVVTTFLTAIFAGWLIALMVWLLPFAEAGKVSVIVILTYAVALGGFAHVIAGSVDTLYLVGIGRLAPLAYVTDFLVPTLLGNVVGGVALVAALNHAQVTAGDEGMDA